jgi:hypothetical protein
MTAVSADEIYPNAPLQGVVFEIRFPGEPAIECHRDQFFQMVRQEFPQVLVPKLREGDAAALTPYHFVSEDNSRALLTAVDGKDVGIFTKISHGEKEIGTPLAKRMQHQLRLQSQSNFRDLVGCPLTSELYLELLRRSGYLT